MTQFWMGRAPIVAWATFDRLVCASVHKRATITPAS